MFPISNLPSQVWDIIRQSALPHIKSVIFQICNFSRPPLPRAQCDLMSAYFLPDIKMMLQTSRQQKNTV
jgi:hypothetical protein